VTGGDVTVSNLLNPHGAQGLRAEARGSCSGLGEEGRAEKLGEKGSGEGKLGLIAPVDTSVELVEEDDRDVHGGGRNKGVRNANSEPSRQECQLRGGGCETKVGVVVDDQSPPDWSQVGVRGVEAPSVAKSNNSGQQQVEGVFCCTANLCRRLSGEEELARCLRGNEPRGENDTRMLEDSQRREISGWSSSRDDCRERQCVICGRKGAANQAGQCEEAR
jgi:hypothetical protein